ncbi:Helix-turn-helix domain-containing protein [Nonomuraea solani]|uniref:Helix-turn-helix domain-containing protein n=1 Tax=Nonomuraea solani TaxID=1144553 RepID=A0A1H6A4G0_9ACTN|nr:helix-turn-helix transcriptional regulator [Nonomuraea solani]SEG43623.1 Helix-turn-helix domain-containing protein [Nonomuraea solani]
MDGETFGQVLRRLRGKRTLQAVANAADISISYVHKLENGHGTPTLTVVEALDAATHAGGELIEAYERNETPTAPIAEFRPSTATMSPVRTLKIDDAYGEDTTERRRLLQMAAGLGAVGPTEALRQLIDLSIPGSRPIEDWELACADHLHAIRHRPPAQVQADVRIDLTAVLHQLRQATAQLGADHAQTRGLYRALSALSTLHANVLTRLGDHGAAIRWWRTARHAADASGDLHLQLGVRSTEAGHGISGSQRDPMTVLRMLDAAQPIMARAPSSYGAALIDYTRAKALSMVGRHDEACDTLERISERLATEQLPVGIMADYWRAGQLPFARVWVYSAAGDESRAVDAREQVIASNPDRQYPVIARLLTSQCTVVNGGIDEGLREAADILDELPAMHRTTLVMRAGRMVLSAVPVEQRGRAAVGDLRSMLAIEA